MPDTVVVPSPIGESVTRVDGVEKLTGAAKFTDDLQFGPGLLYGRLVRSPHAHARILSVDAAKALGMIALLIAAGRFLVRPVLRYIAETRLREVGGRLLCIPCAEGARALG